MNAGAYSATFRLAKSQADILDAVTDNLANSATPGHRRSVAVEAPFDAFLSRATGAGKSAAPTSKDTMVVDFTPGPYRATDNPLDMAINGKGFFVLEKNGAEYYTRNGSFRRATDGTLVSQAGLAVAGEGGPIRIPEDTDLSNLTVDAKRTLHAGKTDLGRLRVAAFSNPDELRRAGPTLFSAPAGIRPEEDPGSAVANRTLESSNTSVFEELTELISCTRAAEACQKMIKSQDDTEGKTISSLGR
jgi:flagellar basal-body rod protein FlgF